MTHQFINDYNLRNGGAQKVALSLHYAMIKAGLQTRIVSITKDVDNIRNGVNLKCKGVYGFLPLYRLFLYCHKEVSQGDVIHVHLFPVSLYVAIIKRLTVLRGCKIVFTEHSTHNRRRNNRVYKVLDKFIYKSFDNVIAISNGVRLSLIRDFIFLDNNLLTITNGIELNGEYNSNRSEMGPIKIASVGRLKKVKNYELAIRGISLLTTLNFEYHIAGEGDRLTELKKLVEQLNLQDKIFFHGFVHDISEFLGTKDIFLMTSQWEGFGLALVEAMNHSLPSIVSNIEGVRDILGLDNKCGILTPPNSPKDLAENLTFLIKNADLRERMGKAAYFRSKEFSMDKMIEKYYKVYYE